MKAASPWKVLVLKLPNDSKSGRQKLNLSLWPEELMLNSAREGSCVCEIFNIFSLLNRFLRLSLNENLLLLNFLLHFFHLVPCILEFYVFKVNSNLHAEFLHISFTATSRRFVYHSAGHNISPRGEVINGFLVFRLIFTRTECQGYSAVTPT